MKRIFVDIDSQVDFLDRERGALFVPDADKLIPNLQALILKGAKDPDTLLIGSLDAHDWSSEEFIENGGQFPRHCVKGTAGQLKVPELVIDRMAIISKCEGRAAFRNESGPVAATHIFDDHEGAEGFYFEKDAFSMFDNEGVEELLHEFVHEDFSYNKGSTSDRTKIPVFVFGVATDFCVLEAALRFRCRGHPVCVVGDAIAAVTPAGNADAFSKFWDVGIETVFTKDLIK